MAVRSFSSRPMHEQNPDDAWGTHAILLYYKLYDYTAVWQVYYMLYYYTI